jgi:hypothetical protein
MAQIMEVEPTHAGLLDGVAPGRLEVRPARDAALGADEYPAIGSRFRPPLEVCPQVGQDHVGDRNIASTGG